MPLNNLDYAAGLAASVLFAATVLHHARNYALPLPPGPAKRFLAGNIPDMPTKEQWLTFDAWKQQYGDMVHLRVGGQDIILVYTHEAAFELMERRSSIYSDRPPLIMLNEFAGFEWSPSTMRYGPVWRQHRALLHRKFHPTASEAYEPAQDKHTRKLLCALLSDSTDPIVHIKQAIGALIMEITYGIEVQKENDPWIELAEQATLIMARVNVPGAFLVDSIPLLRFVPEWMPGGGWKRQARIWKQTVTRLADAPFEHVREQMASCADFKGSIVSDLLKEYPALEDARAVRNIGAIIYAAGADTTAAILHVFLLAMVLHPDAQKAAQAEMDIVLGREQRLPMLADRAKLPYLTALLKEVHRWHPVQPLNGQHVCTQDDEYRGFRIPKGASIHSVNWSMFRDPVVYGTDVDAFRPERFLGPNPPRDPVAVFGYGRRACLGRYFAENTVFLAAARILQVFDIRAPADSPPVEARFKSAFFSPPEPFMCEVQVRSDVARTLVMRAMQERPSS